MGAGIYYFYGDKSLASAASVPFIFDTFISVARFYPPFYGYLIKIQVKIH